MAYLLQTAARKPLHSIITLTNSNRLYHTIITQLLHSCCTDTGSRNLQFSERAMNQPMRSFTEVAKIYREQVTCQQFFLV